MQRSNKAGKSKNSGNSKASLQDIWEKLATLESLVKRNIELDSKDMQVIQDLQCNINAMRGLAGKKRTPKFESIIEWKEFIWNSCRNRQQHIGCTEISFQCRKLKKSCGFEQCPLNAK